MRFLFACVLAFFLSCPINPGAQEPRLIRHLVWQDLERPDPGPFDAFVYGHHGFLEKRIEKLILTGEEGYRYFNILTLPLPEWVGGGNPWFDWIDSVATVHDAFLPGRFPYFGNPRLLDWSRLPVPNVVAFQTQLLPPCQNVFLDNFFFAPAEWMGVVMDSLSSERIEDWSRNIFLYVELSRRVIPGIVLLNGDDQAPMPIFLENAQENWKLSVKLWRKNPQNVLSVDAPFAEWIFQEWQGNGAISFTGTWEEVQPLYERASER